MLYHINSFNIFFCEIESTSMYKWTCSPYDSANENYSLPYFGETSEVFELTWQISVVGVTYVYPINFNELNCTGLVTALEFCYTTTLPLKNPSSRNAFQFLTLTRTSHTEFEVTRSIQVTATPSQERCRSGNPHRCCEIMEFSLQDQFNLITPNLAIGFGPQQDSQINPQRLFPGVYPMYTASSHISSTSLNSGSKYNLNAPSTRTLRLSWLHLGK